MENVIKALKKIIKPNDIVLIEEMSWNIEGDFGEWLEDFNKKMNHFLKKRMVEKKDEYPLEEETFYTLRVRHEYMQTKYPFHVKRITLLKIIEMFYNEMPWIPEDDCVYWGGSLNFIYNNQKYLLWFNIHDYHENSIALLKKEEELKTISRYEWQEAK